MNFGCADEMRPVSQAFLSGVCVSWSKRGFERRELSVMISANV